MFDIHQRPFRDDWDDQAVSEYINGLMEAFAESPEGKAYVTSHGEVEWAGHFTYYGLNYPGTTPAEMTVGNAREVIFELFPRKISTEPEAAREIVAELRAFWQFLGRAYHLREAPQILELLGPDAESRLARELANPRNFGMAKSFLMMGTKLGFDMTTQAGLDQFVAAYNGMLASPSLIRDMGDDEHEAQGSDESDTGMSRSPARFHTPDELRTRDRERRKQLKRVQLRRRR
jgi:hypothetical protein